jgi:hypothetical protein
LWAGGTPAAFWVNDAGAMGARESIGKLGRVLEGYIGWQTVSRNRFVERFSGDVLHHHEVDTVLRADVMDDADIGMLQRRN